MQKKYTTSTLPFTMRRNKGEKPQFYIDNSHPAIIDRATYEAAQRLQGSRRVNYQTTAHPLTGKLRCPDCGATYRRQVISGKARWTCSKSLRGETQCNPIRLWETSVHEAALLMINKLMVHREYILTSLIEQLETLSAKANGTQQKVYQVDQQIAALTAQCHALARLHNKGILASAAFTAQTGKLNGQLTQLRNERRAALCANDNDDRLNELRALNDLLAGLELQSDINAGLFCKVVQSMTPSAKELQFTLLGGLVLPEPIPNAERRWKR